MNASSLINRAGSCRDTMVRAAMLSSVSGKGARHKFITRPGASTHPFMACNPLVIEYFPSITGTVVRATPAEIAVQLHFLNKDEANLLEAIVAAIGDGA